MPQKNLTLNGRQDIQTKVLVTMLSLFAEIERDLVPVTNRMIGGNAPSKYLPRLQRSAGIDDERLGKILKSHLINQTAVTTDNFEQFFKLRWEAFLQRIENAMAKPVAGGTIPSLFLAR
ncbi:MAG TPA: hypothetical protein VMT71_05695 [Syntrophorhabdales bacterium]|nr:hypothetical protein [Syntrophorhabdales bacterium]